jgi:DNA-binding XRE family transcriptional regulator
VGISRSWGILNLPINGTPFCWSNPGKAWSAEPGFFFASIYDIIRHGVDKPKIFSDIVFTFFVIRFTLVSLKSREMCTKGGVMPTIEIMGKQINGSKLRNLRENRFWSRAELADKSGVHADHIGRIERGEWRGASRLPTIRRLAEALGVDPSELIEN